MFEVREKTITRSDIQALRSIKRQSVNNFDSNDIQKAEKWARKYYQELKEKSPFFRAWFGDWRAYSTDKIHYVRNADKEGNEQTNIDTGWSVNISSKIRNEKHLSTKSVSGRYYIKYINELVQNSVLLDSAVSDNNNENSVFSIICMVLYKKTGTTR